MSEFEGDVQGRLINFNGSDQAVLDILSGKSEPSGLVPLQMPAHMHTVETQMEDVPLDMVPHTDAAGNTYTFGFGMNWSGTINDERTQTYRKL